MNVISFFDGMSCGQIALNKLGVKVENYFASEIDKFAIQQTQYNFPNTIQLGDILNWRNWDIDFSTIDLVCAGSPCQGFSFAGKQLAFDDPRSKLFFVFVEILNHIKKLNPKVVFLLENVNMKKEYLRIISEYLGVFPVRINSNLVSAQNRDRWYWTNIKTKAVGLFDELWTDIPQPKDKGILLKDILQSENEVDKKYYINRGITKRMLSNLKMLDEKLNCFLSTSYKGAQANGMTLIKVDKKGNKKADQNKAGCLTGGGHSGGNHSDMDILLIGCARFGRNEKAKAIRKDYAKKGKKDYSPFAEKEIVGVNYNKMNTITCATQKDNLILIQNSHGYNKGGEFIEKSPTITSNSWEHNNHIDNGYRLRRLTIRECSRLQTVPENYRWIVSNTQAYKMLGNGWTVDVISHILGFFN